MTRAFRCDQCSAYFEGYPLRNIKREIQLARRTDGLFFLDIEVKVEDVHKTYPPDLCEQCFRELVMREAHGEAGVLIPNSSSSGDYLY